MGSPEKVPLATENGLFSTTLAASRDQ
jgi:hypothetical protein